MKHKAHVIIDADPATVWRYFDDPDNLARWQPTLRSFKQTSGERGHPDAVCELHYEEHGRKRIVTETITARREPDFLAGTRESDSGNAVVVNHFEETDDGKTRWVAYWNHAFKGLSMVTTLFTHGSIRKRTEDDMNRFKLLVETAEDES